MNWHPITANASWQSVINQQINQGRIPHATLLHGESLPTLFKAINELTTILYNQEHPPIHYCPSDNIQEPTEDVILINCPSSIKINLIKSLFKRIQYGPANHDYLLVIIHNIDCLTKSSTNALLKTIESPPKNTLFFLTSPNKHRVIQTLKSRTQHLYIPPCSQSNTQELASRVDLIQSETTFLPPSDFLKQPIFDQIVFIQSLPNNFATISAMLNCWQAMLASRLSLLNRKEFLFLEKIIEIISNIAYNINLKSHLMHASLLVEEEDLP